MILFLVGFLNILIQSVLIRETYFSIASNEISTCIFLSAWLMFNGIGVLYSRKNGSLVLFLTFLTLLLPVYLIISYNIPVILNKTSGEMLKTLEIFLTFFVIYAPIFFIIGSIFGRGLKEWGREEGVKGYIRPYIYEAFGSLLGGIFFSYVLIKYVNFYYRYYFIFVIIILLYFLKTKRYFLFIPLVLSAALLTQFLTYRNIRREIGGYKFVGVIDSNYSRYIFREKEGIKAIFIDGNLTFSYPLKYYDEICHLQFITKDNEDNKIISIGLPSPSESEELMKEGELTIVTNDKNLPKYYPNKILWVFDDPLNLKIENKYDFIIINTGLPDNISKNRFYTIEFLKSMKTYLKYDGILVMKVPSSDVYISPALKEINGTIIQTGLKLFNYYYFFPMETGIFLFSDVRILIDKKSVSEKLERLKLYYLNEALIEYIIQRSSDYKELKNNYRLSRIKDPVLFYLFLKYYGLKYNEKFIIFLRFLEKIPFYFFAIIFIIPLFLKSDSLRVSLIGFLGIGVEIIVLFLFQSVKGSLYQYVGAIVGSFMLGMGIGGSVFEKRPSRFYIPIIFLLFSFIFFTIITIPTRYINTFFAFLINSITGLLVGLTYSSFTFIGGDDKKIVAAKNYFLDLLGASCGSLFFSLFLLPVYGVDKTALIFFIVSLIGFILRIIL